MNGYERKSKKNSKFLISIYHIINIVLLAGLIGYIIASIFTYLIAILYFFKIVKDLLLKFIIS